MDEKKTNKLYDIKETVSGTAEIMRQMSTPGVLDSLNNVKETATKVNEIIQGLRTPEMIKNIENFRLISENMNEASKNMQNTVQQLRDTGVINETTNVIKSAKEKLDSFCDGTENNISGQDIYAVGVTTKEMLVSIKDLINELTITIASSKKSEIICNVEDTVEEISDIYKTTITQTE